MMNAFAMATCIAIAGCVAMICLTMWCVYVQAKRLGRLCGELLTLREYVGKLRKDFARMDMRLIEIEMEKMTPEEQLAAIGGMLDGLAAGIEEQKNISNVH